MSRKFLVLSALALGLIVPASAKVYTRDEAVKTAMENSAAIKAAEEELIKASSQVEAGYGKAYPSIDLSATVTRIFGLDDVKGGSPITNAASDMYGKNDDDGNPKANVFDKNVLAPAVDKMINGMSAQGYRWQSSVGLTVTQILYAAGNVGTGIEIAKAYKLKQEIALENTKNSIRLAVDNAFNAFILADSSMAIIEESIKLFENTLEFVKQQYESGLATELDVARLQLKRDALSVDKKTAEERLLQNKNTLLSIMGIEYDTDLQFIGELRTPSANFPYPDTVMVNVKKRRKDLQMLDATEIIAEKNIEIEESGYKPTVALLGGIKYANNQNEFYKWDAPKWDKLNKYIALNLSMNLFKGMQTKEAIVQAKSNLRTLQVQKENTERAIRLDIENGAKALENSERNLVVLKQNIELAEKIYDMTETSYKNGMVSQLELLQANLDLRTAKTNYLTAVMAWNINYNSMLQITGEY